MLEFLFARWTRDGAVEFYEPTLNTYVDTDMGYAHALGECKHRVYYADENGELSDECADSARPHPVPIIALCFDQEEGCVALCADGEQRERWVIGRSIIHFYSKVN